MPTRDNFERMRIEAELRKLGEMEAVLADMGKRLDDAGAVFSDDERLRKAIAPILGEALRDAGVEGHDEMSRAIAPYIINTIHTEITNSQDELVEVIQPKIGVMIREGIANAVEELNRKVDEALPVDRWVAAAKGRLTGAPPAGFILGDASGFSIKEALLIERKSGSLLARQRIGDAEDDGQGDALDEDLLAAMIAGVQQFASDAFGASGAGDLRRFSFTEDTVYLRTSATKLLAVRCSGVAPPDVERRIDILLERALEQTGEDSDYDSVLRLEDLAGQPDPDSGVSASTILGRGLGAVAAAFLLFWGNGAVKQAHQDRWTAQVGQAVHAEEALTPYPLSVALSEDGGSVRVAGLLPDDAARERLERRIEWAASPLTLDLDLDVIK